MPGKMPSALNQFSLDVMKIGVGEAPTKNLYTFRKKNHLLFFQFYNSVYILKVGPWANVSNAFLFITALLGSPGYCLQFNSVC